MPEAAELPIAINRKAPPVPLSPFEEYFRGFDRVQAVRDVFGDQTEKVLGRLKVGFISNRYMYMGVGDNDGNLRVGTYHLKNSDLRTLYLDIVHELFHVRQFIEDKEYFSREHRRYLKKTGFDTALYYRSPIEVPAYKHAVDEAKRIGLSYDEIAEYLKMGPVDPRVFSRFLNEVGLERGLTPAPRVEPRVTIKRKAKIRLHPFTDYFHGFEKVEAVRGLFGAGTEGVLGRLKVEFSASPIRMITPDEDDGHLQVSVPYLETADERLVYLDVLVCLNLFKRLPRAARKPEAGAPVLANRQALVESYGTAVKEARRLGMRDAEIVEHLTMPRFVMGPSEFRGFLVKIGLGRRKKAD